MERVVAADSAILIPTYERQIKQLEEECILIEEKIKKCGTMDTSFEEVNRTAKEFLANPYDFCGMAYLSGKRLVLKVTFPHPLAYHQKDGYRTAALALPFAVLRDFSNGKSGMVEPGGIEPPTSCLQSTRSPS